MSPDSIDRVDVASNATVGVSYEENSSPPAIGPDSVIRGGTILYDDVETGRGFQTGHHTLVREQTALGDDVLVGTQAVIDGYTTVGDSVSMQTGVYVPSYSDIGTRVFIGPNATLLNDKYPVRANDELVGPTLEDDVSIGANATILPEVTVAEGAFVAAGAVVTDNVPAETLAVGAPAEFRDLPAELQGANEL